MNQLVVKVYSLYYSLLLKAKRKESYNSFIVLSGYLLDTDFKNLNIKALYVIKQNNSPDISPEININILIMALLEN
jgi:hypothetical protein